MFLKSPVRDECRDLGPGSAEEAADLERTVFPKAALLILALVLTGALIARLPTRSSRRGLSRRPRSTIRSLR